MKSAVILSLVVLINSQPAAMTTAQANDLFMPKLDIQAGAGPYGLASADFNLDGWLDLAVTNAIDRTGSDVSVFYGNATGTFDVRQDYETGLRPFGIIAADLNMDGTPDLAVGNYYEHNISVLHSQAGSGFGTRVDYPVGGNIWSLVAGDFTSDGIVDLVAHARYLAVIDGQAGGGFSAYRQFTGGEGGYGNIIADDFNGDGVPDLAKTTGASGILQIFYTQPGGQYGVPVTYAIGSDAEGVVSADFNGDSITDLAIAHWKTGQLTTLLGQAGGGFGEIEHYAVGGQPRYLAAADFDMDGLMDLAISQYASKSVAVLFGQENGGFGEQAAFAVGDGPVYLVVEDFNKDGLPDIATANHHGDSISILYNAIPEPGSATLLVMGGLIVVRRRTDMNRYGG